MLGEKMQDRTQIDYDMDYADISYGTDKENRACMDPIRRSYILKLLKKREFQNNFLKSAEWEVRDLQKGGFGELFILSKHTNEKCVVKVLSLVQILGLRHQASGNDFSLLKEAKEFMQKNLEYLKNLTGKRISSNLCDIQNYCIVPFFYSNMGQSNGDNSYILTDYLVCIKEEILQKINYRYDFLDAEGKFDEDRLIDYGIQLCESLRQLNRLHRDIQPDNVMKSVENNGIYKLIDFDTIMEENNVVTHQNFKFVGKHCGNRSYTAPDANGRFDRRDDIYSAGYVLYDIANYNFEDNEFTEIREYNEDGLVRCKNLSYDLFEVIKKACDQNYRFRFESWEDFQGNLINLQKIWRRKELVRENEYWTEWICCKCSKYAVMKVIPKAKSNFLYKKYIQRDKIYRKLESDMYKYHIHFPKIIEENVYGDSDYICFIEEMPQGKKMGEYFECLDSDARKYYFLHRVLAIYIEILNSTIGSLIKKKKIASLRNLIFPDNIYITETEEIWIKGIAVPREEYYDYANNGKRKEYLADYVSNGSSEESNESASVYAIGLLIYEWITGSSETGIHNGKFIQPVSRISEPANKIEAIIDLCNACLKNIYFSGKKGYTVKEVKDFFLRI